jgi:hypothetical protein
VNPPDIEKLIAEPDATRQQAQFLEFAWFVTGFVILIAILVLTTSALKSLLVSKVYKKKKLVWMIVILGLPIVGPCLFYATRKRDAKR